MESIPLRVFPKPETFRLFPTFIADGPMIFPTKKIGSAPLIALMGPQVLKLACSLFLKIYLENIKNSAHDRVNVDPENFEVEGSVY